MALKFFSKPSGRLVSLNGSIDYKVGYVEYTKQYYAEAGIEAKYGFASQLEAIQWCNKYEAQLND